MESLSQPSKRVGSEEERANVNNFSELPWPNHWGNGTGFPLKKIGLVILCQF